MITLTKLGGSNYLDQSAAVEIWYMDYVKNCE